jgi:hypothetical protein
MLHIYFKNKAKKIYFHETWDIHDDFSTFLLKFFWTEGKPEQVTQSTKMQLLNLEQLPPSAPKESVFIDLSTHQLYIYSQYNYEYNYMPYWRTFLMLLRQAWPDWKIHWVEQGYIGILKLIGFKSWNAAEVGDTYWQEFSFYISAKKDPYKDSKNRLYDLCADTSKYPNCVITFEDETGVRDYGFNTMIGYVFTMGSRILKIFEACECVSILQENHCFEMGMFISQPTKKLYYWHGHAVQPMFLSELKDLWTGWEVIGHIQGLPYQYFLSGRDPFPVLMPFKEIESHIRYFLDPIMGFGSPFNEKESLLQKRAEKFEKWLSIIQTHYANLSIDYI